MDAADSGQGKTVLPVDADNVEDMNVCGGVDSHEPAYPAVVTLRVTILFWDRCVVSAAIGLVTNRPIRNSDRAAARPVFSRRGTVPAGRRVRAVI